MNGIWLLALLLSPQEGELEEVPVVHKEIVIIGTRRESDVLDVPSGVSVITAEHIRRSGASNIKEVLVHTPGFFSQGPNKGAYDAIIDIRGYNNGGGNGQRMLVLVDGRRTNGVTNSATDWASIPIDNIERIEIVRGPAATLYGDPALAGVVNIITRKGGEKHKQSPQGERDTFVEIRAAAGGDEAALFAADLYRMYTRYVQAKGWTVDLVDVSATGIKGFKEIIFEVKGRGAYGRLKLESGVHRVQRVPVTESSGRLHTSTVTVAVLPEAEDVEVEIADDDLRIDIFHAGGHGGQNVNKVATAVRITHLPSGRFSESPTTC